MNLKESYDIVRDSIVAITHKYIPSREDDTPPPEFPPILGTGFIIRENGLIVTNDHVLKAIPKLFKPPDRPKEEWPVEVYLLKNTKTGMFVVPLEVLGAFEIKKFSTGPVYYGPKIPDVGFLLVKVKGLPALKINDKMETLHEGLEVATAGFPMGTEALRAPGWLHQFTPTLQMGIISAVQPFRCASPHGFSVNIMTQGGASGSPVFLPETGEVIGVLYGGLYDYSLTKKNKDVYKVPTNISYVVPAQFISKSLDSITKDKHFTLPQDTPTLQERLSKPTKKHHKTIPFKKKRINKRVVKKMSNIRIK